MSAVCSLYMGFRYRRDLTNIYGSGNLKSLNDLAAQARADCVVHSGDFGFYDEESLKRIADK